jgi:hypothetical protein
MIRAWAGQLANQVYWLRQLGEAELVDDYIAALRATYPDATDEALSDQQFRNKLYGLTHLVLAASGYYRWPVAERDHQWVFDYFRTHLDAIERRGTQDLLAEIGVCFLLAGLDDAPALQRIRERIAASVLTEHGVIPSSKGSVDLQTVEHRNKNRQMVSPPCSIQPWIIFGVVMPLAQWPCGSMQMTPPRPLTLRVR